MDNRRRCAVTSARLLATGECPEAAAYVNPGSRFHVKQRRRTKLLPPPSAHRTPTQFMRDDESSDAGCMGSCRRSQAAGHLISVGPSRTWCFQVHPGARRWPSYGASAARQGFREQRAMRGRTVPGEERSFWPALRPPGRSHSDYRALKPAVERLDARHGERPTRRPSIVVGWENIEGLPGQRRWGGPTTEPAATLSERLAWTHRLRLSKQFSGRPPNRSVHASLRRYKPQGKPQDGDPKLGCGAGQPLLAR